MDYRVILRYTQTIKEYADLKSAKNYANTLRKWGISCYVYSMSERRIVHVPLGVVV